MAVAADEAAKGAETTAQATKEAVERTEKRIADNHLLILIPQMSLYRRELDLAVDRPDRQETLRLLGDWPTLASELQGILQRVDSVGHSKLIKDLERSTKLTGKAKDAIISKRDQLEPATSVARQLITEISASSSKIVGEMKAFTRSSNQ